jgi:hypothetical protein
MNIIDTEPEKFWIGTQAPPVIMVEAAAAEFVTAGRFTGVETVVHEYHCVCAILIPTVRSIP